MTGSSGSLLVADAAVNAIRNKGVKGLWSHSSSINHPVHHPWIIPCRPGAAGDSLDSGAELLPQLQSCIRRDVCREHFTQGCLGGCERESELQTLPGVTRSNSLFECNTNSYPGEPFSLQMAGFWRLQLGEECLSCRQVLDAAGCCGLPARHKQPQCSPVSAKSGPPRRLIIPLSFFQLSNLVTMVSS